MLTLLVPSNQFPTPPAAAKPPVPRVPPRVYARLVRELKLNYKFALRPWRKSMTGMAWELKYADGRIQRLIAAPRPRGPVSAAIFLHEVGHHAIGFHRYASRALEEFYTWQWAFREMETRQIPVTTAVLKHYDASMHHYTRP